MWCTLALLPPLKLKNRLAVDQVRVRARVRVRVRVRGS